MDSNYFSRSWHSRSNRSWCLTTVSIMTFIILVEISVVCNEGNSLIATCLDPNKYYYIQVDGGEYATCDLIRCR
jgi:hypothetical protein